MRTMTGNLRRMILSGGVSVALVGALLSVASADVASDQPGAILVVPKIVVDSEGQFTNGRTDTELQITNTSNQVISARCFFVNANGHCGSCPSGSDSGGDICRTNDDCGAGGVCANCWTENDFKLTLTKRQPISWRASQGLLNFPLDGINKFGPNGQSNKGSDNSPSSIPPVQEDPFIGELKCVEVDPGTFNPSPGLDPTNNHKGDLKGEATIVSVDNEGGVDARKYNGIAIQSTGVQSGDPLTLTIGGPGAEYNGCPNTLILNHLFDGATVSTHGGELEGSVRTDLTVVPCSEDFRVQENNLGGAVLQFLVYNEFEQRFSTSTRFSCFKEVPLSDIDTRPGSAGDAQSIFNVGVQGTLSGQTRIRPVEGATLRNGVLGVAESFFECESGPDGVCSTASNIHFTAARTDKGDVLTLSPEF